jgi:hypothetical protein
MAIYLTNEGAVQKEKNILVMVYVFEGTTIQSTCKICG